MSDRPRDLSSVHQPLSRRRFVALSCGAALPVLLSACGGGSAAATTGPTTAAVAASGAVKTSSGSRAATGSATSPATSAGSATSATAAARAPGAGQVTVTFTVPGGQAEDDAFKPVFAEFAKRYPDIKAVYAAAETGYVSEYDNKLLTSIAGGVGPDVFKIWPSAYFGSMAAQGTCVDLDPYIAKDPTIDMADFFPEHVAACKFQGKMYALPNDGAPQAMWYNVDAFKKAGVDLPTADWNWDALLAAAKKLTVASGGRISQFGLGQPPWLSWVWSNGGEVLDAANKTCLLNSSAAVDAFTWIQDRATQDKVIPSPGDLQSASSDTLFTTGRLAMTFGSRGNLGTYQAIKAFHFDVAPLPKGGKGRVAELGIGYTAIWTKSKVPDQAYTVAAWVASPVGEQLRISTGFAFPSRKSLVTQDWFAKYKAPMSASDAINTTFTDELNAGEARAWPPTAKDQQIQDAINKQIGYLWDGKKPAKQMADDIVTSVNAIVQG
jgi:multiple sugar transport system substrate-binding protein